MGSTTTYGEGYWRFYAPVWLSNDISKSPGIFSVDDGDTATNYMGVVEIAGNSMVSFRRDAISGSNLNPTSPLTWATDDTLVIKIDYEI
jgi:hypothetical protein